MDLRNGFWTQAPRLNAIVTSQGVSLDLRANNIDMCILYTFYRWDLSCRNHWGLGAGVHHRTSVSRGVGGRGGAWFHIYGRDV